MSSQHRPVGLTDMPTEVQELIATHLFEDLTENGRPRFAFRNYKTTDQQGLPPPDPTHFALLSTCKQMYAVSHEIAYTNIEWDLDPYHECRSIQGGLQHQGRGAIYFLENISRTCARHLRYVRGNVHTLQLLLSHLEVNELLGELSGYSPDRKINVHSINPNQFRVAMELPSSFYHSACSSCGHTGMAARFWLSYLTWIAHPHLQSYEWLIRETTQDQVFTTEPTRQLCEKDILQRVSSGFLPECVREIVASNETSNDIKLQVYGNEKPRRFAFCRDKAVAQPEPREAIDMSNEIRMFFRTSGWYHEP